MSVITSETVQVHKNVLRDIAKIFLKKKLAHAYLFIGPDKICKSQTALELAKLINCENNIDGKKQDPCQSCPSCIKIHSGNHPDITLVDKGDNQSIKIAVVRGLVHRMQLRPYEARIKVVIIKNIEDLTIEGGNALLKTLEEPTKNSMLILTTSVPEQCLATVRSRCHPIYFFPLATRQMRDTLQKNLSLQAKEAHFLALYTEGSMGKAVQLHEEEFFLQKNEIIDNMIFNRNNEGYIKSLATDKERLGVVLDVLLFWFRDMLLIKSGIPSNDITHLDRMKELQGSQESYSFEGLNEIIEEIVNAKRLLNENLNIKIPMQILKEKI